MIISTEDRTIDWINLKQIEIEVCFQLLAPFCFGSIRYYQDTSCLVIPGIRFLNQNNEIFYSIERRIA